MVGTLKNIVVVFEFHTDPGRDHIDPSHDHADFGWDISSGYVLEAFYNFGAIWSRSGLV